MLSHQNVARGTNVYKHLPPPLSKLFKFHSNLFGHLLANMTATPEFVPMLLIPPRLLRHIHSSSPLEIVSLHFSSHNKVRLPSVYLLFFFLAGQQQAFCKAFKFLATDIRASFWWVLNLSSWVFLANCLGYSAPVNSAISSKIYFSAFYTSFKSYFTSLQHSWCFLVNIKSWAFPQLECELMQVHPLIWEKHHPFFLYDGRDVNCKRKAVPLFLQFSQIELICYFSLSFTPYSATTWQPGRTIAEQHQMSKLYWVTPLKPSLIKAVSRKL